MNIEEQIKKKLRSEVLFEMKEEAEEFKTQLSYDSWLGEILVKKSESEEEKLDTYISDLRNNLLYYVMNDRVSEDLEKKVSILRANHQKENGEKTAQSYKSDIEGGVLMKDPRINDGITTERIDKSLCENLSKIARWDSYLVSPRDRQLERTRYLKKHKNIYPIFDISNVENN
ncbi:hypothetical protein FE331_07590 [Dolosigranulum pigrum]|uniref:hypothetical protein n=1 Tax=Dolosigranulum pigrum TaxID=29394 RepID=UPI001AD88BF3|nr:hypothetical protein [Dolosigranulum pigrum]QTJ50492.1 hypothetical protein FE331_07590 [Dolosigranulum pigrum]